MPPRTLSLLRHAKSAYPAGVGDHTRPLAERGLRDAAAAGPVLRERLGTPDVVLVSSAVRAQQTWAAVARAWSHPPHQRTEDAIYEASTDDLLLLIRETEESVHSLLLVGHNPGFEELSFALASDDSDGDSITRMGEKFPTCGLAILDVPESWGHLVHHGARIRSFDVPRG